VDHQEDGPQVENRCYREYGFSSTGFFRSFVLPVYYFFRGIQSTADLMF